MLQGSYIACASAASTVVCYKRFENSGLAHLIEVAMSVRVDVALLSGRSETIEVEAGSSIDALAQKAQALLGVGRSRVANSAGQVLPGTETVQQAGLKTGDVVTLHTQQVEVACARWKCDASAFAAIQGDASVLTWGDPDDGGDCSSIQDRLVNVQKIQASLFAFAALLGDGSVVTWGNPDCGGDSAAVQEKLKDVREIQSNTEVFAALLGNGRVVTWGNPDFDNSSAVQERLLGFPVVYPFALFLFGFPY